MSDLETKLSGLSEDKRRLEGEREDLVAKIDAGEGANELINQMKTENVSYKVLVEISN